MKALLNPQNIIIGVVALFAIAFYVYWLYKRNKFRQFAIDHNLHSQKIYFKKNQDRTTKQITEIKYPSFKKSKEGITLKNFNYRVLVDEINSHLEQYERFFNCDLIEARIDKNRNILLVKSQMPKEVFAEKAIPKSLKAKIGADDQARTHELDFKIGVRLFLAGASGVGKTSFIETILTSLDVEADYFILGPRKSFNFLNQKYYDTKSVEDLKSFLAELELIKLSITEIKSKMRSENIKDELFLDYVEKNRIDFKFKFFIFDDASTYLRASFYSKGDEMKPLIEKLSMELNKILREFRIYKTSVFVVAHSPLVEEIDISSNNYSHRFFNRVPYEGQSRSITGSEKTLLDKRLGQGLWYVISDNFTGYLRTVRWPQQ